jgi:hypothetical protein
MCRQFRNISQNELREKGNSLVWEICKIQTLIQEGLKTRLHPREKTCLEELSSCLTTIENKYIHPVIASTIDPST